jgi:glycine betaine/proline transport system substrate-binding protein
MKRRMKDLRTKFFKTMAVVLALLMGLAVLAGCGQGETQPQGDNNQQASDAPKGAVKLGYVNWAEGIAMTNLAKVILEDKMNYEVEITMADVGPVFTSVAKGNYDAFLDGWLPITHESYMKEYGNSVVDLGYNYEGARIGLVVPEYVDISSIEELNANKDKFAGRIIGIDSGAGIMKATEKAIEEYGLELDLVPGSDPVMAAALQKAIDKNEWVVVTGWAPHWKFARWNLKFLEDPKGIYGEAENIHTIASKDIEHNKPEVAQFLKNFKFDDQQLGDLMGAIAESDKNPEAVAREWMNNNEELVNSWLP